MSANIIHLHTRRATPGLRIVQGDGRRLAPVPLITLQVQPPNERLWDLIAREKAGENVTAELNALLAQLEAEYVEPDSPEAA